MNIQTLTTAQKAQVVSLQSALATAQKAFLAAHQELDAYLKTLAPKTANAVQVTDDGGTLVIR